VDVVDVIVEMPLLAFRFGSCPLMDCGSLLPLCSGRSMLRRFRESRPRRRRGQKQASCLESGSKLPHSKTALQFGEALRSLGQGSQAAAVPSLAVSPRQMCEKHGTRVRTADFEHCRFCATRR
jgi:hypothetical protein